LDWNEELTEDYNEKRQNMEQIKKQQEQKKDQIEYLVRSSLKGHDAGEAGAIAD